MIKEYYTEGVHLNDITKHNIRFCRVNILINVCKTYVKDILDNETYSLTKEQEQQLNNLLLKLQRYG